MKDLTDQTPRVSVMGDFQGIFSKTDFNGSAFAITPFTVLTCAHVASGVSRSDLRVKGGFGIFPDLITCFRTPAEPDAAVLNYNAPHGYPVPALSQRRPRQGHVVFFVDSKKGLQQRFITRIKPRTAPRPYLKGQFDGKVSPGTSGAPLFNASGKVIGIIYGEITERKTSKPEGQFIPLEDVLSFIEK